MNFAHAKIQPPVPRRGQLLARPALEARLRDALPAHRAVLVCAPAGYGKTALLVRALAPPPPGHGLAWVSLDPGDDLLRLLECLLAARLAALNERTLKVLVETGPWISAEVGGPGVDVASLLPLPAERRAAETPLPHQWGRVGAGAVLRTPARAPLAQSNALGNRSIRSHASA
jgi:hypothetical protein